EGAGDAATVRRAVGQVDPRVPALRSERERRAVDARVLEELGREDLVERGRSRTGVTPPEAGIEPRSVDDTRVAGVEPDFGDPEGHRATQVRLGTVPDLGERLAAVPRLIETRLVCGRLTARLAAVADYVRQAANGPRGADEDVILVARIDDDRADPAAEERVSVVHAAVGGVVDARVRELLPVVATVGRLVDADPSLTAGRAAVRLAGPEIERVARLVGRVERQDTDRGLSEPFRVRLLPVRARVQCVVRPPDAAAG